MKIFPLKIIAVALIFLFCGRAVVPAQGQGQGQRQRWLLVFGTSSAMKKRLPAVETQIKTLIATGFAGKISDGDSIGVWTVGDKMKAGEYPLISWSSEDIPIFTTNLISYLRAQHFSGSANLSALQPVLGQVVESSERLTILIFCDGTEQINWSPYDDGINETLRQTAAERKKSKQPVLLVLRSQQGKFIGAMVNFPPVPMNLPPFPSLPGAVKPAAPAAVATPEPPKPAAVAVPSLIIVGTHVGTNENEQKNSAPVAGNAVPAAAPKANPPPPAILKTNPPAAVIAAPEIVKTPMTNPVPLAAATNPPAATAATDPGDRVEKTLIMGGVGLLVVAVGLVIFLLRRKGTPRGSLITSSMQDKFRANDR